MEHNVVAECSGFHYGAGVALRDGCTGRLWDNLIVGNWVPDICGGGIYVHNSDVEVSWCTIADNRAGPDPASGTGGGIYVHGQEAAVYDCIVWGNQAGASPQIHPPVMGTVTYCDVQGGYPGTGNFSADPRFCASAIDSVYDGYFLSAVAAGQVVNSPCIDAGHLSAVSAGLDRRTTRTDLEPDQGMADLGFHYGCRDLSLVVPPAAPAALRLRVTPNPSHGPTVIDYAHPADAPPMLYIFDAGGRLVRALRSGAGPAGGAFTWDGRDALGRPAPPGLYLLRTSPGATGTSNSAKLVRLR
jgi:hypothetical protein